MTKRDVKPTAAVVEEVEETPEVENVADVLVEATLYLLAHIYGYDNDLYQRLSRASSQSARPSVTPDEEPHEPAL